MQATHKTKVDVRKMTVIGILSAISIMLSMIPGVGYIPIGPTKATIMHIPVIIGSVIEGPIVGASVGFVFGLSSMFNAWLTPTVTSFAFMNPLISVVPRVLMGVLSYYVFKLVIKISKKVYLSGLITGAIGSILNTAGVLGMIYLLYGERYAVAMDQSASAAGKLILTLIATNGVPEAIVGAIVVASVTVALKKVIRK